jgi:hypothetical protein
VVLRLICDPARHASAVAPAPVPRCWGWINKQQREVIDYLQTENRVLREPQTPLTDLPPKDAILFDQIRERFPLPAIEPTGDGQEQEPKHRQVDHERQLISRPLQNGRNPVDREVGHYGCSCACSKANAAACYRNTSKTANARH